MPQIFQRRTNTLIRVGLLVALVLVPVSIGAAMVVGRSSLVTGEGVTKVQPMPYSHELHVGELGLDCRYCHSSVETSASAGIPPTKTCMNCHGMIGTESQSLEVLRASYMENTPLHWTRVHDLPDFVYFDHSIHVSKGVGCSTCHGRVDQMEIVRQQVSLQMDWCLDCHTNPEQFVRPRDAVFQMDYELPANQAEVGRALVEEYQIQRRIDCTTCHR